MSRSKRNFETGLTPWNVVTETWNQISGENLNKERVQNIFENAKRRLKHRLTRFGMAQREEMRDTAGVSVKDRQ